MPIQKIKSGRIITTGVSDYIGDKGVIFYDEDVAELRLSDGVTPGGIPFASGGGGGTGPRGYTGSLGYTGSFGLQGYTGSQGSIGYTGSIGSLGYTGSFGLQGYTGSQGSIGVIGYTGSSGADTYILSTATNTTLGGVKIGANIVVSSDGTISVAASPTSLTDLGITDGISGQYLTTDGSGNFSFTTATATVSSINDVSDVDLVNIQNNQTLIYNSSTAKFENVSINLTGGTTNQILVKQSGSDYDYQWEDLNITVPTAPVYTKLLDDVSTTSTLYLGEALPESVESNPVWRIQKIVFDSSGNVDSVRFASSGTFTQIWNNRTSLIYL